MERREQEGKARRKKRYKEENIKVRRNFPGRTRASK